MSFPCEERSLRRCRHSPIGVATLHRSRIVMSIDVIFGRFAGSFIVGDFHLPARHPRTAAPLTGKGERREPTLDHHPDSTQARTIRPAVTGWQAVLGPRRPVRRSPSGLQPAYTDRAVLDGRPPARVGRCAPTHGPAGRHRAAPGSPPVRRPARAVLATAAQPGGVPGCRCGPPVGCPP